MTTTGHVVYATLYWKDKLRSWHTDQVATKSGPFTESVNAALVVQRRRIFPSHLVTATHRSKERAGRAEDADEVDSRNEPALYHACQEGAEEVLAFRSKTWAVWKLSPEKQLQEAAVSFQ